MPQELESGNLALSVEEQALYRAAADSLWADGILRLRLSEPISLSDFAALYLRAAGLAGDVATTEWAIERMDHELRRRANKH